MSKGRFVIKTQEEADRRTASDGIERYIGEQVFFGTRTNKSALDNSDHEWIPSSIPRPSDFHAWDFPGWSEHAQIKSRDKRKRKKFVDLRTEIQSLDPADRSKLQMAVMVEFLASHPKFARDRLGIPLDGDEPE